MLTRPFLGLERSLQFTTAVKNQVWFQLVSRLLPSFCYIIICHKAAKEPGNEAIYVYTWYYVKIQSSKSLETKWPLILCSLDHTLHWFQECRHTSTRIVHICIQVFFQTTLHLTGTLSSHFPQDGIYGYIHKLPLSSRWSRSIWLHCLFGPLRLLQFIAVHIRTADFIPISMLILLPFSHSFYPFDICFNQW